MKFELNFEVLIEGLFEGILIFTGVYLLTFNYLIKTEHTNLIDQIFNDIDIYIPVYFLARNNQNANQIKQTLIDDLNEAIEKFNEPYQKRKKVVESDNNKLKKKFNTIYLYISIGYIFFLMVYIFYNYKNLKYKLYNLSFVLLMALIVILFEFIYMKYVVNGWWYVHLGDILIGFINSSTD